MFIFPSIIALIIGIVTLFIGKDDPEELGWNRAEEIWEEPIDQENIDSQGMTKWDIFKNISWEISDLDFVYLKCFRIYRAYWY